MDQVNTVIALICVAPLAIASTQLAIIGAVWRLATWANRRIVQDLESTIRLKNDELAWYKEKLADATSDRLQSLDDVSSRLQRLEKSQVLTRLMIASMPVATKPVARSRRAKLVTPAE